MDAENEKDYEADASTEVSEDELDQVAGGGTIVGPKGRPIVIDFKRIHGRS